MSFLEQMQINYKSKVVYNYANYGPIIDPWGTPNS